MMSRLNVLIVSTSLVVTALAAKPTIAAILPANFSEFAITGANTIASGTTFEFSPDGKLFVLEQAGTIEVYQGAGATAWTRLQANFLLNVPVTVDSFFERGMLGIAFDPNYATNRFVYLYYTTSTAPVHNRIVRVTANATGDLALAGSLTPIMELNNLSAGNHNGGAMHFGIDGKLYVAVGDNAVGSNAQSITTRLGKILRLNPDPADPIPADNPASISGISGTTSGLNRAIWAAGVRNPYTFTFKPATSLMYINDVGSGTWEEVNIGAVAANYGWPTTEGPFNQATFPNFTHPTIYYHHTNGALSSPPLAGFTGFAITGGAFYVPPGGNAPTFPLNYLGDYFFADYVSDWIKRYDPDAHTVQNFASQALGAVDLRVGADGALYYLARDAQSPAVGRVYRVQSTLAPPCLGDIAPAGAPNAEVDVDDLLQVINNWGKCADATDCPEDIAPVGGNNVVDVDDLLTIINGWGSCS